MDAIQPELANLRLVTLVSPLREQRRWRAREYGCDYW
jgi:hypothetical protein